MTKLWHRLKCALGYHSDFCTYGVQLFPYTQFTERNCWRCGRKKRVEWQ